MKIQIVNNFKSETILKLTIFFKASLYFDSDKISLSFSFNTS